MHLSKSILKLIILLTCLWPQTGRSQNLPFSTNATHLTIWNGAAYVPFVVKGINLGVAMPGSFPGQLLVSYEQYTAWFIQIKAAGFNTICLYTLHYPQFYSALYDFNRANPQNPLYFFQGVWLEEKIPNYDDNLKSLDAHFTLETEENIDCVHGKRTIAQRPGKAWGTYSVDASDWLIGWVIGREIHPIEVLLTNQLNPTETAYTGEYLSISGTQATEAWMVRRLDHLIKYQQNRFQTMRPVSCSSWPTLDPMRHPSEPNRDEDTVSFDISTIDRSKAPAGFFVSYHAYPYYPDFISLEPAYQMYSDYMGQNSFLGYLYDLKAHYEGIPLIIAEYGLPSSWGIAHYAQSGMHHGGPDENEQGEYNIRLMQNLLEAGCGGGIQFSWLDEWFKRTWLMEPFDYLIDRRVFWQNLMSAEQNFGLIGFKKAVREPIVLATFPSTAAVSKIEAAVDYAVLEIDIFLNELLRNSDTLYLALDTYVDSLGERVLPTGDTLSHGAEFMVMITNSRADLYVTEAYDMYGIWHHVSGPEQHFHSTATMGAPWKIVRLRNNEGEHQIQYSGRLQSNRSDLPPSSRDGVIFSDSLIRLRLPWSLLHVVDPSQFRVIHEFRDRPGKEDTLSDGLRVSVVYRDQLLVSPTRWIYDKWEDPNAIPYEKASYHIIKTRLPLIPGTIVARTDTFYTAMNLTLLRNPLEGVMKNDLLLEPGLTIARTVGAPQFGQLYLSSDGSFYYQPQTDFQGIDHFSYELVNGVHRSAVTTVQIEVSDANNRIGFVQVYPNPSPGESELRASAAMEEVTLFTSTGALLQKWQPNTKNFFLNLRDIADGIYLLRIQSGDVTLYRKLIIHKS